MYTTANVRRGSQSSSDSDEEDLLMGRNAARIGAKPSPMFFDIDRNPAGGIGIDVLKEVMRSNGKLSGIRLDEDVKLEGNDLKMVRK